VTRTAIFLLGCGIALTLALGVVMYLRRPLETLLTEMCGTAERARFWTAFAVVVLTLVPLMFVLNNPPTGDNVEAVFVIAAQLRRAILGIVVSVMGMGVFLLMFVARSPQPNASPGR